MEKLDIHDLFNERKKRGIRRVLTEMFCLCDSMDGTGEHYAKWNKPDSERQIPYDLTYK